MKKNARYQGLFNDSRTVGGQGGMRTPLDYNIEVDVWMWCVLDEDAQFHNDAVMAWTVTKGFLGMAVEDGRRLYNLEESNEAYAITEAVDKLRELEAKYSLLEAAQEQTEEASA